ncbi:hypothetical protein ACLQ2S_15495 [Micromonospora sp. DT48]|uniref:hypothetical protein n=1 Tax=unclassified Micromonospora TaxID=2617518 RepID=UPI0018AD2C52|nr:hypothetical protein [Micromonospora sp. CP22]
MTNADDSIRQPFPARSVNYATLDRETHSRPDPAQGELRGLAHRGELATTMASATPEVRARLTGAAYAIAWPIVFTRVTRPMERRRGHWACATSVRMLADDCLDRHHDDVEAVVTDLLANARVPIIDVERWLSTRLTAATVDGHRRRRGGRGALQRPRVPAWLARELDNDPWLTDLAVQILTWVGVPTTAGTELWPLDRWAQRREAVTGDPTGGDGGTLTREIERVLTAMRRRPRWYADYVERPLGRKHAPVLAVPGDGVTDPQPLVPVGPQERDEARLADLASAAVEAINHGLRDGGDPRETVVEVLRMVFGSDIGSEEIDRVPGETAATDERVSALLANDATVRRIVDDVLHIISDGPR